MDEAMHEMETDSDRAAGLVAATFLENQLEDNIRKNLRDDQEALDDMFNPSRGPLTTFAAKIDLAYLIGLLSEKDRRELHTIRKVRNEFAHGFGRRSFQFEIIRDLVGNLTAIEDAVSLRELASAKKPVRERFILSCQWYISSLSIQTPPDRKPPSNDSLPS
jgi:hypothetical protein